MELKVVKFKEVFPGYTGYLEQYREMYIIFLDAGLFNRMTSLPNVCHELNINYEDFIEGLSKIAHSIKNDMWLFPESSKNELQNYLDSIMLIKELGEAK